MVKFNLPLIDVCVISLMAGRVFRLDFDDIRFRVFFYVIPSGSEARVAC